MENLVISNPKKLKKLKKAIFKAGAEKFHVLSDFDRTLTYAFVDDENVPSLISILRDGNYLVPGYAKKAHALFNKYYPIEINPKISLKEKKKAMREWWITHFELLIKSGLNKKDLKKVAKSKKIKFRKGVLEFIDFLHYHKIPLVIMSASGLGGDIISMYLERENKLYKNIHIVANSFEWDEAGNAIDVKKPIIHGMNKDETTIQKFPIFKIIKNRKNVLLLGDSLGDIGMIDGFEYDSLIKIGFLNGNVENNIEYYKKNYDVIILNDSSMDYVNELLKEIIVLKQ
ncbi:hypothetical protein KKG58_03845 [Patescibacteria group bacterium]|nr:hypothetical protein [Patescibacteria group bacterium]